MHRTAIHVQWLVIDLNVSASDGVVVANGTRRTPAISTHESRTGTHP